MKDDRCMVFRRLAYLIPSACVLGFVIAVVARELLHVTDIPEWSSARLRLLFWVFLPAVVLGSYTCAVIARVHWPNYILLAMIWFVLSIFLPPV